MHPEQQAQAARDTRVAMRGARQESGLSAGHILATVALVGLGLTGLSMAHRMNAAPVQDDRCAPYLYSQSAVDERIGVYLDRGQVDPALVAINTATDLFGAHPRDGQVVFPPSEASRPEVRCVFDRVLAQVDRALRSKGLDADDLPNPTPGVRWRTVSAAPGSADLSTYPWNGAVLREEGLPTPGTFVVANPAADPSTFYKDATASALYLAGMDAHLAYDNNSKMGKRLRREMRDLILVAPFNDERLTSTSATLAGGRDPGTHGPNDPGLTHVLGPHGRGLVWANVHYDDAARLAAGLPAKRGVASDGTVIGSGRSGPLVYVPAVNLSELRGATPRITTEGSNWPDSGRDTIHVPGVIEHLGIDTSGAQVAQGVS